MQLCKTIYYSLAALHVSSDIFAHHQGHLNCITVSGITHVCRCRLAATGSIPPATFRSTTDHVTKLRTVQLCVVCNQHPLPGLVRVHCWELVELEQKTRARACLCVCVCVCVCEREKERERGMCTLSCSHVRWKVRIPHPNRPRQNDPHTSVSTYFKGSK
jgi:hypothetical protein